MVNFDEKNKKYFDKEKCPKKQRKLNIGNFKNSYKKARLKLREIQKSQD